MAWLEQGPSGNYFVCFRVGGRRLRCSLKTDDESAANASVARLEENLQLVQRGRMVIPANADPAAFLLSDGRIEGPIALPERITLRHFFDRYFASIPPGGLETDTIEGMKLHQRRLEKHFGPSFPICTLTTADLEAFVAARAKDKGRRGTVSGTTIKKSIVTLRTVWNWGLQRTFVKGSFPSQGLKYPKTKEKLPFMPFREVERLTRGMSDSASSEFWECVFLTTTDLAELLSYVKKTALHPFLYPLFVFAAHTGARRAEMARAGVGDVDFNAGFVTLHERKRAHGKKTTRRVAISAPLKKVLKDWLHGHPGGNSLFCHCGTVQRSKKRSRTTGHAWTNPTDHARETIGNRLSSADNDGRAAHKERAPRSLQENLGEQPLGETARLARLPP